MGRLVDVDELMHEIICMNVTTNNGKIVRDKILDLCKNEPTAYDVECVIRLMKQMAEPSECSYYEKDTEPALMLAEALKAVEEGY